MGKENAGLPKGVVSAHDEGEHFFFRDKQLVCHRDDIEVVQQVQQQLNKTWNPLPPPSFAGGFEGAERAEPPSGPELVVELEPGDDPREILKAIYGGRSRQRRRAQEPLRVGLNYVMAGSMHELWGPANRPRVAEQGLPPQVVGEDAPGRGVIVGVIDTGIDATHPWLADRVKPAREGQDQEELDGDPPDVPNGNPADGALDIEAGHGTFVAGVILQHAPGATVVVRGALDTNGQVDDRDGSAAIRELVEEHGVDILNLSFGGYTEKDEGAVLTRHALEQAFNTNPDLVVVAAAGNNKTDRRFFPASESNVTSVAALDTRGNRASFTNFGDWVTVSCIGANILSTFIKWKGPVAARRSQRPMEANFEGWAKWSGTSFAAPRIAGGIAAKMTTASRNGKPLRATQARDLLIGEGEDRKKEKLGVRVEPHLQIT